MDLSSILPDPLAFRDWGWPHVRFYGPQEETLYSLRDNVETYVVAGNKLGKDFVAGFAVPWIFIGTPPDLTVRIVTTSVEGKHLEVLWSEINRFLDTCRHDLSRCVLRNHRHLRRRFRDGRLCRVSYAKGLVYDEPEKMAGHHADVTLFVGDEASGLADEAHERAQGWAKRFLYIGNPEPTDNFFKRAVLKGDVYADQRS